MKNKTQARVRFLVPNFRYIATPVVLGLCLVHSVSAAITTWTGASDDNWATAGNWNNDLPAGNDVIFSATDATGTSGPSGTVNNFVAANTAILSLRYNNLTTAGFHNTRIDTGITLSLTGGDAVATTSANPIIFVNSPTTANTDVVYATIQGAGTLLLNNPAANLHVGQGTTGTANTTRRATLDMSGLASFDATIGRMIIGQQTVVGNRANGTIVLADSNAIDLTSDTAPGLMLGEIASNNGNSQILELGTENTILTNTGITIGGRKGNGILRFNPALATSGTATFRSRDNLGRQSQWNIGNNSAQTSGASNAVGTVDFTGGEVDALVGTITLGRSGNTTTPLTEGTLTLDSGTIDTDSLIVGIQPTTAGAGKARATVNVNGTAKLLVNGNVTLGRHLGEANNSEGAVNIGTGAGNGELKIVGDLFCGTGTGNKITVSNGGLLRIGGIVGKLGAATDAALETLDLDSSTLAIDLGSAGNPTDSRVNAQNVLTAGTVNIVVSGSNLTPGVIKLIDYSSLGGSGYAAFNLVPIPGIAATLEDNILDGSLDLKITGLTGVKWDGTFSGSWDINGTANWLLVPGGTSATYQESAGAGPRAFFDDTATGTKTVDLTTALSPLETVVNNGVDYTFTGSGGLIGAGGLIKQGSGSLILENSGDNNFTGGVRIEGGTLRLAGANDQLPVAAVVTLSDASGAQLDLNGTSQTLAALNGGGATGGAVQLGSGTLTLTAAGSYAGVLQGSGSLVRSGTGNHVLSGANSFTGGTTISGGRITVANATGSGLGTGPVQIALGGELALGDGTDTGSIAATTIANDGLLVINRSDDTTLDKDLIGTGGLSKTGEGILTIGSAKTYGGLTTINGGAIRVTHPQALGNATDALIDGTVVNNPATARLIVSGGVTLAEPIQLAQKQGTAGDAPCLVNAGDDNTLTGPINLTGGGSNWNLWSDAGKLTISGTATNTNTVNTRNLRFYGDGNGEIQSVLADGAGTSLTAVLMNGQGTWTLSGNNTYTAATTVNSGTLIINGTQTASAVSVAFGATLGGTGETGTIAAAGTIAPGNTGIGTLKAGDTNLNGLLAIELSGAASDQLSVTGTLELNSSTVTVSGTPVAFSYIIASATTPITGAPVLDVAIPGYDLVVDGNLLKLNSTGPATPYSNWANVKELEGVNALPETDVEKDGLSNLLEFVLGGNPNFNDTPSVLPQIEDGPSSIVLRFSLSDDSRLQPVAVKVQVSADLAIWNPADDILIGDENGTGPNGVSYTVTPNGEFDDIVVTVPKNSANVKFARLQAVIP